MKELNYTLYIDESGVSSNKITFNNQLENRSFFALGSLKAQKKDIDEFYNLYLKKFEIDEEIKYKALKKDKAKLHEILNLIDGAKFNINIEFVESQLYYLTLFCNYVFYPIWLFDDDDDVIELRQKFFKEYSNYFDKTFFNLLDNLFISKTIEEYEKAYNDLIPFLIDKQIVPEEELLQNLELAKNEIMKGSLEIKDIKPLSNQHKSNEIIVLPHLQCLYNLIIKANDAKTIIHDENFHYQQLFYEDIKQNFKKNILFKDSKTESGLKVIDIVVSYCKNTIENMIKNHEYEEINMVNTFIDNINFIVNKDSLEELFYYSYKDPLAFLKVLKNRN